MLNTIFSDSFAHKSNFLTRIDARIKMIFVFGTVITTLLSATWRLPVIVSLLSLVSLLSAMIPLRIILLRLFAPLSIAAVILLIQVFYYGNTPLFKLTFFGFSLVGYNEGLWKGILLSSRVMGCTSLIIFLSMTTPVNIIFGAARWFRIPKTWVEIAAITYRYVFVLLEDAITIRDAQKVRLGYSSLSKSIRSLTELSGSLFIRAYDQSLITCEAMRLRGYSGHTKEAYFPNKLKPQDVANLIIFSIILFLLIILNIYWR